MIRHILGSVLILLFPSAAAAEEFSLAPIAHISAIADFPLTETILAKMEKVQKELLHLPDEDSSNENSHISTIEGLTAALEKRPELMSVLADNTISARDYVMAYMALAAVLSAVSAEGEKQIFDETPAISKENLAFGRKYANRIRTLLDE